MQRIESDFAGFVVMSNSVDRLQCRAPESAALRENLYNLGSDCISAVRLATWASPNVFGGEQTGHSLHEPAINHDSFGVLPPRETDSVKMVRAPGAAPAAGPIFGWGHAARFDDPSALISETQFTLALAVNARHAISAEGFVIVAGPHWCTVKVM